MVAGGLVLVLFVYAERLPASDAAWYNPQEIEAKFPARYPEEVRRSQYVTLRDGCRIAVEVFLPKDLKPDDRIPTLIHQTRYWRSVIYHPPFDRLRNPERLSGLRRFLVPRGYAWVSVDVRGSGASFGYRPCEYSPDEIQDGKEIVDWVVRQPWSDGQVCATGISYDGGAAELLATHRHPAVKAVAPLFSMFDPYQEVAFPGGIHLSWFTQVWGGLGQALDRNTLPELLLRNTVRSPNCSSGASGLWKRIAIGRCWRRPSDPTPTTGTCTKRSLRILFRDDRIPYDWTLSFDAFSPYIFANRIDASGTAVYSYSGWFDAAFAHAAIKRHLTLTGRQNRLTLGPWNHGGEHNSSPCAPGRARFNMRVELFRFFEHILRKADTGIQSEKPVHYYTMGQEKWKAADTWPPAARPRTYYFGSDAKLTTDPPTSADAADDYTVDDTHGTGSKSRWNCLVMGGAVSYPDRAEQDKKLLCYTTDPLTENTEITGHPVVALYVSSPRKDGDFFIYIEDVDEAGHVHYVSEGMLRAIHRKISRDPPPYKSVAPYRTYRRADAMELVPGQPAELTFDILPFSYEFKAGHRIRVALAGVDVDHFARPPGPPPTIRVHRGAALASRIVLPIIPPEGG